MIRRILAAIAAATWLGGCVSILGVDAEDHDDVSAVICGCSNAGADLCEAFVTSALERSPEIEEQVLDCAASESGCAELDACLAEAGVCSGKNERCSRDPKEGFVQVRCCGDLACGDNGRCSDAPPEPSCVQDGFACDSNAVCCGELTCLGTICQACGDRNAQCEGDLVESTCCDGFTCVGGNCAAVP